MSRRFPGLVSLALAACLLSVSSVHAQDEETPAPAAEPAAPAPVPPPAPAPVPPPPPVAKKTKDEPAPIAAPPVNRELPDCYSYMASPLDNPLFQDEKKIYYVSPKLPSDKGAGSAYLVETDFELGKSKRLAGYRGGKSATLLEHGVSPDTVSIFDFTNERPDCGEGQSTPIAIKWSEQKVLPSFPAGKYAYVQGDMGGRLANLDSGLIQDIDLLSKQKRTLESFAPGSRPLYLKTTPPFALFAYNTKSRELSKFVNNKKTPEATLRLKEGMRILQQGDQFGIVQIKNEDKSFLVSQIKDWSGKAMKNFEINLPPGISASSLALRISFPSSQVLIFGKDQAARKSLRQVFFYTGKDLSKTYKAPDGAYFSNALFGKDRGIILLLKDSSSHVVREVWKIEAGSDIKKIDAVKEKKLPVPSHGSKP